MFVDLFRRLKIPREAAEGSLRRITNLHKTNPRRHNSADAGLIRSQAFIIRYSIIEAINQKKNTSAGRAAARPAAKRKTAALAELSSNASVPPSCF